MNCLVFTRIGKYKITIEIDEMDSTYLVSVRTTQPGEHPDVVYTKSPKPLFSCWCETLGSALAVYKANLDEFVRK